MSWVCWYDFANFDFRPVTVSTRTFKVRFSHTHLAGFQEVKANVGVTGHRVQAILAEVLVDVFWCRLGQEAVYTLPKRKRRKETVSEEKLEIINIIIKRPHSILFQQEHLSCYNKQRWE